MTTALIKSTDVDLDLLQRTAKLLAASGYFDAKGDSNVAIAQIATKILAGRELGYGPFASVQGIHIVQGKPTLSANLMAAAVKAHPHYSYRVRKMTDSEVSIEFFEDGESLGLSTFTEKDAQAAGLTGKSTWKQFPRNMLFARAMSNGVRWFAPDVFSGTAVYVPEEMGTDTGGGDVVIVDGTTGEVLESPPTPVPTQQIATNGSAKPAPALPETLDELPELDPDGGAPDPNPFHAHEVGAERHAQPTHPGGLPITDHQRKLLHVLGTAMYNGGWEAKRHELVKAITKGRSESSNDLTGKEAVKIIAGIEAKLRERYGELVDEFTGDPNVIVEVDELTGFDLVNAVKALQPVTA